MQAMSFNKYLGQKQLYLRNESFKVYMRSLYEPENARVVNLSEEGIGERSVYQEMPEENSYQTSFKSN